MSLSQQPTPRTDAAYHAYAETADLAALRDFICTLECENQELRKDNARLAALAAPQQFKDANGNTYEGNFVSTPAIDTTGADYIVAPDGSAKRVK